MLVFCGWLESHYASEASIKFTRKSASNKTTQKSEARYLLGVCSKKAYLKRGTPQYGHLRLLEFLLEMLGVGQKLLHTSHDQQTL